MVLLSGPPVRKKNYPQDQGGEMNAALSRNLLVYQKQPLKVLCQSSCSMVCGQNISKTPVKKFIFSKVAGWLVMLRQMDFFTGIFQELWH